MFLNEEKLRHEVIVHECLHLAMAHERLVLRFNGDYGRQVSNDEERLCYYHGEAVEVVYEVLRENGHMKRRTR
jgi:hypothetical protein